MQDILYGKNDIENLLYHRFCDNDSVYNGSHQFDNVMTQFIINMRTDEKTTDVNLLSRKCSLTHKLRLQETK